jgi:hypothetical protein
MTYSYPLLFGEVFSNVLIRVPALHSLKFESKNNGLRAEVTT